MTIDAPGDAYEGLQLLKVNPENMRHNLSPCQSFSGFDVYHIGGDY
jgi:hypothetical protein